MIVKNQKSHLMKKVALVVPPGLEPGLFCTKNRRVANYTMGQLRLQSYEQNSFLHNIFEEIPKKKTLFFHHTGNEQLKIDKFSLLDGFMRLIYCYFRSA